MHTSLAPFPWHALERVPRSCLRSLRSLHECIDTTRVVTRVAEVMGEVLGGPLEVVPGRLGVWSSAAEHIIDPVACVLANADGTLATLVEVDPAFAHAAVSVLLSRAAQWPDRSVPAPRSVHAAVGAVVVAAARRLFPDTGLQLRAIHREARPSFALFDRGDALFVDSVLHWQGSSYVASLAFAGTIRPTHGSPRFSAQTLYDLGDAPLCLHVVGAVAQATREELAALRAGDAWMPGKGWIVDVGGRDLQGDVVLIGASSDIGRCATVRPDGRIVLREGTMRVQDDLERDEASSDGAASEGMADVLAEVPVVVRVELGTVTLSAREWAAVRPGDVMATGKRIAERATLRVGGVVVAHGELVDVEGEVGVRIHELVGRSDGGVA